IQEAYTGDLNLVRDTNGGFCNETSLVLLRVDDESRDGRPKGSSRVRASADSCEQTHPFLPGAPPWLYAKIYAGPARVDEIVSQALPGLLEDVRKNCPGAELFFIRYRDPEFHLRMRVRADPDTWNHALASVHRLLTSLQASDQIWRCELCTYEREVERYGGEQMIEMAERVFSADSSLVLALASESVCLSQAQRKRWTIKSVDALWRSAGYVGEELADR